MRKVFSISLLTMMLLTLTAAYNFRNVTLAQQPPVASFTYTPKIPLVNQTVTFDASASYDPDGTIIMYTWDFGDGSPFISTTEKTVTHAYSAIGNYTVTLVVADNDGLKGNTTETITVNWYPKAIFTYSPTRPLINEVVTFNASSSMPNGGTIVSYFWDFGDGYTVNLTDSITTHTYTNVGNYTVTLTVKDSYGLTDNYTKLITVIKPPVADFTFSPTYPIVGEVVIFNASSSTPNGGTIVSYEWNFGDGQTGSGEIVTHSYTDYGNYTVTLTITDSENLTDTISKQVPVRQYPTASFTYSPNLPYVNEVVTFNASSSTPNGGTIVSYEWNFGDGQTGSGEIVTHSYTNYGTYSIKLTVTDSEGLTATTSKSIRVIIGPVANFTHFPLYPSVNQSVLFNATLSYDPDGTIVSYIWDFGDGNITTTNNPLIYHIYTVADVYKVTLIVKDNDGLTANTSKVLGIYTTVPTHDVAVTSVVPSQVRVVLGSTIYINVTVENQGTVNETFYVSIYYNNNFIAKQAVYNLPSLAQKTIIFNWNTSGVTKGYYNITAVASRVTDEIDIADNVKSATQLVEIGGLIWMEVEPTTIEVGLVNKTFNVNINIKDLDINWRAVGIQFRLCYNDTLLEPVNVTEGSFMQDPRWNLHGTFFIYYIEKDPIYGPNILIGIMLYPNETGYWNAYPHGNGTLATITFKTIYQERGLQKPPLTTNLTLKDTMIIDNEILEIPFKSKAGTFIMHPTNIADFNYDGKVDMKDIARVAKAFGSDSQIYVRRWDPICDLNNDGKIDMRDIAIVARNFGWVTPYN